MDRNNIDAIELIDRINNGESLRMLDVREPIEYHSYNIGGLNIPLADLTDALPFSEWDRHDEIIVICKAGLRSRTARSILRQNGYSYVRNLTDGLIAVQKIKH